MLRKINVYGEMLTLLQHYLYQIEILSSLNRLYTYVYRAVFSLYSLCPFSTQRWAECMRTLIVIPPLALFQDECSLYLNCVRKA